jgi:hypothetical protein
MASTDDISIPQIKLSVTTNQNGMNCLMFSPLQMVSLGLSGIVSGSGMDGTGINCRGTDRNTGQQSEMPVFTGHSSSEDTSATKNTYSGITISGLVKLIKTTTLELSRVTFPQIDCLVIDCQERSLSARVFDNIRMAVATCGNPSRYYNRCYLSGRDYTDDESNLLTGMHFSGAQAIYGDRFYLVSLQYSKSLEPIFPVADAYFNLTNKLIPLKFAAPRLNDIADGREYLKCQVKRTSGQIQLGFVKLDTFSMLSFKSRREVTTDLIPYITVYFNSNGECVLDVDINCAAVDTGSLANNELKFPVHDCFKAIKVSDFLAENPKLTECFRQELVFEYLTLEFLAGLMKGEQH